MMKIGDDDDRAHHQRVVAVQRRIDEVASDARYRENRLHDHRAGKKRRRCWARVGDRLGRMALRAACLPTTVQAESPSARAVRTWFERSASIIEPRISRATIAICGSASVTTGPILLSDPTASPAGDRHPGEIEREYELIERRDDEGRHGAADRRNCDHRVVAATVLVERRDDAERAAHDQRQRQRRCAELNGDRQADPEEVGDGEIRKDVARPEIAVQEVAQIARRYCCQSGSSR